MKYSGLILLVLLCYSCSNEKNSAVITIDVMSSSGPEIENLSEIASDVKYIPLETHPEALMRGINYLKTGNEKFYINTVMEILCFDRSGKFLYKLDQKGRGPDEYLYLSDYDINPEKNQLLVLTTGKKLNFYDETKNGFFISGHLDLNTQPRYCDFLPDQDNILLSFTASTGENKYQCVCISSEGDTLFKRSNFYRFTRRSKVMMGFNYDNIIFRNDEMMRIKGFLTDTIFTIGPDHEFIPFIILNTGGKSITTDFLADIPMPDISSGVSPTTGFFNISEILETGRYLFYRYFYQKESYWVVYDKNTEERRRFEVKNLLKDDISGGINFEPKFVCDGKIYSWTDALSFKNHMLGAGSVNVKLKDPERAARLKELAASIKEDDNHILIEITPKK
ncbi:MAG: 6-bladed beta-propeller [Bacteroidales bacterium]|nr:6-bladed beta-propeller [Bacteroidales bacterium]